MTGVRQLAGQTAIYGLSSIVGRLLNFLLVPLYTRIFMPAEFGVVTEIYAYVAFLIIVFTYGFETAYFRFAEADGNSKKAYSTAQSSIVISSVLFAVAFIFLADPIAAALRYPGKGEYIVWMALILAADAVSAIPFARLRRENKAVRFAFIKLIGIGINIALNLFFLVACPLLIQKDLSLLSDIARAIYNPQTGVGYVFISNVVSSVLVLVLLLPELISGGWRMDNRLWKNMIIYSLPLTVAGLAGMVNETVDRILLKFLSPDKATALEQVGIYGACYKLAMFMTLFVQAFRYAAEPFFFSQATRENPGPVYAKVMDYFVIAGCLIFLAIMFYMDIVKHFIGKEFHEGIHIVPILLMANLALGIYYNLSVWYKLSGKTRFGAYMAVTGALITLGLNFWLIPRMGYTGAAWTTLVCYVSMTVISYTAGQRHYHVPYNKIKMLGYPLLSLLLFLVSWQLIRFGTAVNVVLNTVLLLAFAGFAFYRERTGLHSH